MRYLNSNYLLDNHLTVIIKYFMNIKNSNSELPLSTFVFLKRLMFIPIS